MYYEDNSVNEALFSCIKVKRTNTIRREKAYQECKAHMSKSSALKLVETINEF